MPQLSRRSNSASASNIGRRPESRRMTNGASKMWSGRFREPLNKQFEEWQRSFPFDWRLIPQEVVASKDACAHDRGRRHP